MSKIDWDKPLHTIPNKYPVRVLDNQLKHVRGSYVIAIEKEGREHIRIVSSKGMEYCIRLVENIPPEVTYKYRNVHDNRLMGSAQDTIRECNSVYETLGCDTRIGILRLTYEDNNLIRKELLDDYLEIPVVHSKD